MEPTPNAIKPLAQELTATKRSVWNKAALYCERIPVIRRLPLPVIGIIVTIGAVNIAVWVVVGIILVSCDEAPSLKSY